MPNFSWKDLSLTGDFKPSVLFYAEGESEVRFIEKVISLNHKEHSENCAIVNLKGKDKFSKRIKLLSKEPNFPSVKSIGILVDAESDPGGTHTQIVDVLGQLGFPNDVAQMNNDIIHNNNKTSGFFIMPDRTSGGRIEDLIINELKTSKYWDCIQQYVGCIDKESKENLDTKAIVQIAISTINNGSLCGVGRAFLSGDLNVLHQSYSAIVSMIEHLITNGTS